MITAENSAQAFLARPANFGKQNLPRISFVPLGIHELLGAPFLGGRRGCHNIMSIALQARPIIAIISYSIARFAIALELYPSVQRAYANRLRSHIE